MPRGRLRVYVGVAPGVGTSHAMLDEGHRRLGRGVAVVVGALGDASRPRLTELAAGLERLDDAGGLDVARVLERRPSVVLVDDLADADGRGGADAVPRWRAIEALLDAGIDVIATTDVRRIESLGEVVTGILGHAQVAQLPDSVLYSADQLELVDMAPEALRRRLAHGGLVAQLDATTAAEYSLESLAALRELAVGWMAGALGHASPTVAGEVRERFVVAVDGDAAHVLRRAARLASRSPGAELHAVHVVTASDGTRDTTEPLQRLAAEVGAGYQEVVGSDVAGALLDVARARHATQLVVPGGSRSGLLRRLLDGAGGIDVHVLTGANHTNGGSRPRESSLTAARVWLGFGLGLVLPVALTAGCLATQAFLGLTGTVLVLLIGVVVTAIAGGFWPALLAAVLSSQLLNYFFIPPLHTLAIAEPHNIVTLASFVVVAMLVGTVVQRSSSEASRAGRAAAEARTLAAAAEDTLAGEDALTVLLDHVRSSFGMTSVSLLERRDDAWTRVLSVGPEPPGTPEDADVSVPAGTGLALALNGRTLAASDLRVLGAVAAQAQGVLERDRLAKSAAVADRLSATERLRDALLVAVGHDLRTPLAAARTAVSALGQDGLEAGDRTELLATAQGSLERLSRLVDDLLDLSRLQAGTLRTRREEVWIDEVVSPALDELGPAADHVAIDVPEDLPPCLADAALVKRALVNLIGNALRHSPAVPPTVRASAGTDHLEIRIIDSGPGVPAHEKDRMFTPFQRLGDTSAGGLGLGLALSRGLIEAMGGRLVPEDTPGGGLTMVINLPLRPKENA